jgi:hypothetical protein
MVLGGYGRNMGELTAYRSVFLVLQIHNLDFPG